MKAIIFVLLLISLVFCTEEFPKKELCLMGCKLLKKDWQKQLCEIGCNAIKADSEMRIEHLAKSDQFDFQLKNIIPAIQQKGIQFLRETLQLPLSDAEADLKIKKLIKKITPILKEIGKQYIKNKYGITLADKIKIQVPTCQECMDSCSKNKKLDCPKICRNVCSPKQVDKPLKTKKPAKKVSKKCGTKKPAKKVVKKIAKKCGTKKPAKKIVKKVTKKCGTKKPKKVAKKAAKKPKKSQKPKKKVAKKCGTKKPKSFDKCTACKKVCPLIKDPKKKEMCEKVCKTICAMKKQKKVMKKLAKKDVPKYPIKKVQKKKPILIDLSKSKLHFPKKELCLRACKLLKEDWKQKVCEIACNQLTDAPKTKADKFSLKKAFKKVLPIAKQIGMKYLLGAGLALSDSEADFKIKKVFKSIVPVLKQVGKKYLESKFGIQLADHQRCFYIGRYLTCW